LDRQIVDRLSGARHRVLTRSSCRRRSIRSRMPSTTQPSVVLRTGLRSASTTSGTSPSQSEAQDQLAQRRTIERSRAPKRVQLSGDALAGVDQPVGLDICRRWQAEPAVSPAGEATAEADRDHGAQIGIPEGPHQHIGAGRHEALDDRSTRRSSSPQPDRSPDSHPPTRAVRRRCRSHPQERTSPTSAPPERRFPAPPRPSARDRGSDPRRQAGFCAWPAEPLRQRAKASRPPAHDQEMTRSARAPPVRLGRSSAGLRRAAARLRSRRSDPEAANGLREA
jgi:hypothetical protein